MRLNSAHFESLSRAYVCVRNAIGSRMNGGTRPRSSLIHSRSGPILDFTNAVWSFGAKFAYFGHASSPANAPPFLLGYLNLKFRVLAFSNEESCLVRFHIGVSARARSVLSPWEVERLKVTFLPRPMKTGISSIELAFVKSSL